MLNFYATTFVRKWVEILEEYCTDTQGEINTSEISGELSSIIKELNADKSETQNNKILNQWLDYAYNEEKVDKEQLKKKIIGLLQIRKDIYICYSYSTTPKKNAEAIEKLTLYLKNKNFTDNQKLEQFLLYFSDQDSVEHAKYGINFKIKLSHFDSIQQSYSNIKNYTLVQKILERAKEIDNGASFINQKTLFLNSSNQNVKEQLAIDVFINKHVKKKQFAPIYCLEMGNYKLVEQFILKFADVEIYQPRIGTLLTSLSHYASLAYNKDNDKHTKCLELIKLLLERGANPNAASNTTDERIPGNTGLHDAALVGDEQLTSLLCKYGANPKRFSNSAFKEPFQTPLVVAQKYQHKTVETIIQTSILRFENNKNKLQSLFSSEPELENEEHGKKAKLNSYKKNKFTVNNLPNEEEIHQLDDWLKTLNISEIEIDELAGTLEKSELNSKNQFSFSNEIKESHEKQNFNFKNNKRNFGH